MGNILIENGKAVGVIAKDNGSVSVTADGVKTFSQLMNELYALVDRSKSSPNSTLVTTTVNNTLYTYHTMESTSVYIALINCATSVSSPYMEMTLICIRNSSSYARTSTPSSVTDLSTIVLSSGTKLTFYY